MSSNTKEHLQKRRYKELLGPDISYLQHEYVKRFAESTNTRMDRAASQNYVTRLWFEVVTDFLIKCAQDAENGT